MSEVKESGGFLKKAALVVGGVAAAAVTLAATRNGSATKEALILAFQTVKGTGMDKEALKQTAVTVGKQLRNVAHSTGPEALAQVKHLANNPALREAAGKMGERVRNVDTTKVREAVADAMGKFAPARGSHHAKTGKSGTEV